MLSLAAPVVVAEVGWVTMGIADTLMVGPLGAAAIGAVGLAGMLFFTVAVFAMGLLLGLDPLVAQAYGARREDECHRWLIDGMWLSAIASLPFVACVLALNASLASWGLSADVLALTRPYMSILAWSLPLLLLYAAFRRYLQGMGIVRPVTVALIVANVVNVVANWILIHGRFGAPAMGVQGSAVSTVIARALMVLVLWLVIQRRGTPRVPRHLDPARLRRLVRLGFPAAAQGTLEVGVFAAATALAGRLSANALAAHQIALHMAAFTFMVPFGVASAGAVSVGQAVGRRDPRAAWRAGWTALLIGAGFMSAAAAVFLIAPRRLVGAFTHDPAVVEVGASLLFVAAVFQLFDGLQGVATGILRGLGDTRTAMLWNLAGHWGLGLPLGYTLCFGLGFGVTGLWWGLSAGLMVCGIALVIVWAQKGGQSPFSYREGAGIVSRTD